MVREVIFKIFFYLGTFVICLIFIPALILPRKITFLGGRILGYWIKICLALILSVKIEVKGKEILIQ